jgi:diadenosine tetraphosphate (Ap4A) HIT family hydrolase
MTCLLCSITPEAVRADPNYPFLAETSHWTIVLPPNQCLLGRCVVRLRRHAESIGDLADSEMLQFRHVASALELAERSAFGATMFNWSCLMNLAFRANPPDPHAHWWLVPRYERAVDFAGLRFEDPEFASPYDPARSWRPSASVLQAIAGELTRNLALQGACTSRA